jgi:uncharacterized protein (TIGR03067 family)
VARKLCLCVAMATLVGCSDSANGNKSNPTAATKNDSSDKKHLPKTDSERIQGAWVLSDAEDDGRKESPAELGKLVWSFDGDKYSIRYATDFREGIFKLDPDKTPKAFDQKVTAGADRDKSYRGIYKFIDDELILCFAHDERIDRPREFLGSALHFPGFS